MTTVLIVEDQPDILELEAELLQCHGYKVEKAENGKIALEILNRLQGPCIVLLNVQMPEMTGPELLAHLRASGRITGLTIIVLTASALTADELGVERLIRKPVSSTTLLNAIADALSNDASAIKDTLGRNGAPQSVSRPALDGQSSPSPARASQADDVTRRNSEPQHRKEPAVD
jgi:CheY-like chemotaxis protein